MSICSIFLCRSDEPINLSKNIFILALRAFEDSFVDHGIITISRLWTRLIFLSLERILTRKTNQKILKLKKKWLIFLLQLFFLWPLIDDTFHPTIQLVHVTMHNSIQHMTDNLYVTNNIDDTDQQVPLSTKLYKCQKDITNILLIRYLYKKFT